MSSISAGTTTTTGYVVTSDTTGSLVLKTGASDTTAVTINGSQNVTFAGSQTLSAGTANGVTYLNGSKVLTSGSALTFDGTNFASTGNITSGGTLQALATVQSSSGADLSLNANGANRDVIVKVNGTEQARFVGSTGYLGIGTSSPAAKLDVSGFGRFNFNTSGSYLRVGAVSDGTADIYKPVGDIGYATENTYGHRFTIGGLTKMLLDSAGNLGLGVTPSAWYAPASWRAMQIGNAGIFAGLTNTDVRYTANSYLDSAATYRYVNSGYATFYNQANGTHTWHIAPSGTAGNAISFTQAMTLDASGNLGVGATSISAVGAYRVLDLNNTTGGYLSLSAAGTRVGALYASASAFGLEAVNASAYMQFITGGAERARIDSSGNLLVGQTTNPAPGRVAISFASGSFGTAANYTTGTGTCYFYAFNYNGGGVGNISSNGTTTTYATSSDYRLKNITGTLTGYKERLMSLLPKQGTWIIDGSEFRGFVAHDFANPYPKSVTGEKDAVDADGKPVMQSMQASSSEVMADLVAMIQEQQAIIQQLQADVAALKGN